MRFTLKALIGLMVCAACWLGGYRSRGGDLDRMHEEGRLHGIAEAQGWEKPVAETVLGWQRDGYLKLPD